MAVGCERNASVNPDRELRSRADSLVQAHVIVDGHVDLPYRLMRYRQNVGDSTLGDFDYPRARSGGLDAPFMSIYIPVELQDSAGAAKARADSLINLVEDIEATNPDKFEIARTPDDVERIAAENKIALPMGMENGAGLEDDLSNVEYFYDRGIRYITLTHATHNRIGDASYDTTDARWGGLSPFGRDVVGEMNRLGIMVDVSHVTDSTAYDVLDVSTKPVIASHSSCRHFTPDWERNLSDDLIKAIADNGGVVMINFGSSFLKTEYQDANDPVQEKIQAHLEEQGWAEDDPRAVAYYDSVRSANPVGTVTDVADHIDHVVNIAGIDHVGLGSDYDGVFSLPRGLQDASTYPNLVEELLRRQYSDEDIAKILGGNALRVWRENK
ncbi:peptidase M19 [Longibacter salinarum]|uniref:Peptidase M19 n=2 Tax=Longibacter salinarum TaxID=1850348 RepID=A0A2A8CT62_9BACT|nr:peptidase M19 [Longibacter salinarum]